MQFINSLYWVLLFSLSVINGILLLVYIKRNEAKTVSTIALPLIASFYSVVAVHFQVPVYLYFTTGLSAVAVLWWMVVLKPRAWIQGLAAGSVIFLLAVSLCCHAAQPLTRSIDDLLSGAKSPLVRAGEELKGKHLWIDPDDLAEYTRIMRMKD